MHINNYFTYQLISAIETNKLIVMKKVLFYFYFFLLNTCNFYSCTFLLFRTGRKEKYLRNHHCTSTATLGRFEYEERDKVLKVLIFSFINQLSELSKEKSLIK